MWKKSKRYGFFLKDAVETKDQKKMVILFIVLMQRFYESGSSGELSAAERKHVSRFHTQPGPGQTTSTQPRRKPVRPRDDQNVSVLMVPRALASS